MIYFNLLNILSHLFGALPAAALFQNRLLYEFLLFIGCFIVSLLCNLMPFSHSTFTRQVDNAMICLLMAIYLSTFYTSVLAKRALPIFSLTFYVGLTLLARNQDVVAVFVQTMLITITGVAYMLRTRAVPRLRSVKTFALIAGWFVSNILFLVAFDDQYVEILHRIVTGCVFYALLTNEENATQQQ